MRSSMKVIKLNFFYNKLMRFFFSILFSWVGISIRNRIKWDVQSNLFGIKQKMHARGHHVNYRNLNHTHTITFFSSFNIKYQLKLDASKIYNFPTFFYLFSNRKSFWLAIIALTICQFVCWKRKKKLIAIVAGVPVNL